MERIGVCYWSGTRLTVPEVLCVYLTARSFDTVYWITDLPKSHIKSLLDNVYIESEVRDIMDNVNVQLLNPDPLHDWIKRSFSTIYSPNYIADILTYHAYFVLDKLYSVLNIDKVNAVCKFDTDAIVYNRVLLDYLLNLKPERALGILPILDQSLRIWGNPTYRNCGVCICYRDLDIDFITCLDRYIYIELQSNATYTAIGPKLANGVFVNSKVEECYDNFVQNVSNITVHPGELSKGCNTYKLDKSRLALHLTISDIRKYNFDVSKVELYDGQIELTIK